MPQVPIIATPSVLPQSPGPVYQRLQPDTSAWMAPGRALASFGESLGSFGASIQASMNKASTERDAADANNQWILAKTDQAEADANYYSLEGKNAVDAYPNYVKTLQEIRDKHLAQLGSERAKKLFDNDFTRSTVNDIGSAARHAATQHKVYVSGMSDARVQAAINDSAAKFGDEKAFNQNLLTIREEVAGKGSTEGWSKDKVDFETNQAEGRAYAARIREMAIYDPFTAEKLFNDNMGKLDPDAVPIIENAIRTSKLTTGVKQGIGIVFGQGDIGRPALTKGMMSLEPYKTDPTADLRDVHPGLTDSMAAGATHLPPGVTLHVTEGFTTVGHAPHSKHKIPGIGAVDYTLYKNGVPIPNSGPDTTGLYGLFARATLMEMRARHPGLDRNFRYGGTFETSAGSGRADLGHMDVGGRGGARIGAGNIPGGAGGIVGRVIGAESGGRSGLISPAGAVGIMQILPTTAQAATREMGIPYSYEHLLHDDSYNVMIGKHILNKLLSKYSGNEMLAAAAYNAGEEPVDKWISARGMPHTEEENKAWAAAIPYAETRKYVAKVMGSEGVGYDPAPGKTYMIQNQNLGTGANGLSLSARLAQAQAYADQVAHGDVEYAERLLSATRTRFGIEHQANQEEADAADNLLTQAIIDKNMTSEEEIYANPQLRSAWENLDGPKKREFHNLLKSNAKEDIPETQANMERFYGMREILDNGTPEQKAKVNPLAEPGPGEPEMTKAQIKRLMDIKTAKRTAAKPTVAPEDRVNIQNAMAIMGTSLRAAGLILPPGSSGYETSVKNLAAFKGQFNAELNALAKQLGKPPNNKQIEELGSDLLQKVSYLKPSWWTWGGEPLYMNETEVPLFVMSKQALQDYLEITPEAADVVMKAEVPEEDRQNIIDTYVKRTGHPPATEEIIWKIYQHGQFERQRLISKGQRAIQ